MRSSLNVDKSAFSFSFHFEKRSLFSLFALPVYVSGAKIDTTQGVLQFALRVMACSPSNALSNWNNICQHYDGYFLTVLAIPCTVTSRLDFVSLSSSPFRDDMLDVPIRPESSFLTSPTKDRKVLWNVNAELWGAACMTVFVKASSV